MYCFCQLVLSKQSACRPIATQMFARAFVANKCASNGKWKHMQTQGWRGRGLALHTFWNCARVAENCAKTEKHRAENRNNATPSPGRPGATENASPLSNKVDFANMDITHPLRMTKGLPMLTMGAAKPAARHESLYCFSPLVKSCAGQAKLLQVPLGSFQMVGKDETALTLTHIV